MSEKLKQVGGDHYQSPIPVWDFTTANKLDFLEGNVVKYVTRWKKKDGLADLMKAKSYLNKLIENEQVRLQKEFIADLTDKPIN